MLIQNRYRLLCVRVCAGRIDCIDFAPHRNSPFSAIKTPTTGLSGAIQTTEKHCRGSRLCSFASSFSFLRSVSRSNLTIILSSCHADCLTILVQNITVITRIETGNCNAKPSQPTWTHQSLPFFILPPTDPHHVRHGRYDHHC